MEDSCKQLPPPENRLWRLAIGQLPDSGCAGAAREMATTSRERPIDPPTLLTVSARRLQPPPRHAQASNSASHDHLFRPAGRQAFAPLTPSTSNSLSVHTLNVGVDLDSLDLSSLDSAHLDRLADANGQQAHALRQASRWAPGRPQGSAGVLTSPDHSAMALSSVLSRLIASLWTTAVKRTPPSG